MMLLVVRNLLVLVFLKSILTAAKTGGGSSTTFYSVICFKSTDHPFCGGAVISVGYVLTAAQCVNKFKTADLLLVFGFDKSAGVEGYAERGCRKIHLHPEFDSSSGFESFKNDVALVDLSNPLKLTKYIAAAPFVFKNINQIKNEKYFLKDHSLNRKKCHIMGYDNGSGGQYKKDEKKEEKKEKKKEPEKKEEPKLDVHPDCGVSRPWLCGTGNDKFPSDCDEKEPWTCLKMRWADPSLCVSETPWKCYGSSFDMKMFCKKSSWMCGVKVEGKQVYTPYPNDCDPGKPEICMKNLGLQFDSNQVAECINPEFTFSWICQYYYLKHNKVPPKGPYTNARVKRAAGPIDNYYESASSTKNEIKEIKSYDVTILGDTTCALALCVYAAGLCEEKVVVARGLFCAKSPPSSGPCFGEVGGPVVCSGKMAGLFVYKNCSDKRFTAQLLRPSAIAKILDKYNVPFGNANFVSTSAFAYWLFPFWAIYSL